MRTILGGKHDGRKHECPILQKKCKGSAFGPRTEIKVSASVSSNLWAYSEEIGLPLLDLAAVGMRVKTIAPSHF
jgi:hypothetical protein